MFRKFNPNPQGKRVGDCTVRAISKVTGQDWYTTYIGIVLQGLLMGDMPSSNAVWGEYLRTKGFTRHIIPNYCPECYTVAEFAEEHPQGTYLLALSSHVVAVQEGNYFDTWDSGEEVPLYYWKRKDD